MKKFELLDIKRTLRIFTVLILFFLYATAIHAQEQKYDLIIKNDGTKIESVVQYVELDVIKYKNFNNLEGPLYSISKEDVATILYANGTVDVFQKDKQLPEIKKTNEEICDDLKSDFNRALKLRDLGYGLCLPGSIISIAGILLLGDGMTSMKNGKIEMYLGAFMIPIGIHLTIAGAILAGIFNHRMKSKNKLMNEMCSIPLNKGGKRSVNLSFTTSGLALRF